jgi:hypothetical protein
MVLKQIADRLCHSTLACGLMAMVVLAAAEARSEGLSPASLAELADRQLDGVTAGVTGIVPDTDLTWNEPFTWFIPCDAECAQQPVSVIRSPMPAPSTDLTREVDLTPVSGDRFFTFGILDWVLYLQPIP